MTEELYTKKAVEVLEALVAGKDPVTREALPTNHFALDLSVNAALWVALGAVDDLTVRLERRAQCPNSGELWTIANDYVMARMLGEGAKTVLIAKALGRTENAVRARIRQLRAEETGSRA